MLDITSQFGFKFFTIRIRGHPQLSTFSLTNKTVITSYPTPHPLLQQLSQTSTSFVQWHFYAWNQVKHVEFPFIYILIMQN